MSTIDAIPILLLRIEIVILLVATLVMAPAGRAIFRLVGRRCRALGAVVLHQRVT